MNKERTTNNGSTKLFRSGIMSLIHSYRSIRPFI